MSNINIASYQLKRNAETDDVDQSSSTCELELDKKRSGIWEQHVHTISAKTTVTYKDSKVSLQQEKVDQVVTDPLPSVPHGSEHIYLNVWAPQCDSASNREPDVHAGLRAVDRFPKRFNYRRSCANVGSSFAEHFRNRGSYDKTDYHDSWDAEVHLIIKGVDGYGNDYNSDYLREFAERNHLELKTRELEGKNTTYVDCTLRQMWEYDELKEN